MRTQIGLAVTRPEHVNVAVEAGFDYVEAKAELFIGGDLSVAVPSGLSAIPVDVLLSPLPRGLGLSLVEDEDFSDAVKVFDLACRVAADLGARLVSFGCSAARQYSPRTDPTAAWRRLAAFLETAVELTAAYAMDLAIEVLDTSETNQINTAQQASRIVDQIGADNLGVLLDLYQIHASGLSVAGEVAGAGSRLLHLHTAEPFSRVPPHTCAPQAELRAQAVAAGYGGRLTVEAEGGFAHEELAASLHLLHDVWAQL